jgi:hypothetical protein
LIEQKLTEKMKSVFLALDEIKAAVVTPQPNEVVTSVSPRARKFVCPCGQEFKTGFDLGKHKKGCYATQKVQPSLATPTLQPKQEV